MATVVSNDTMTCSNLNAQVIGEYMGHRIFSLNRADVTQRLTTSDKFILLYIVLLHLPSLVIDTPFFTIFKCATTQQKVCTLYL